MNARKNTGIVTPISDTTTDEWSSERPLAARRDVAERDADADRDDQREDRQLDRRGEPVDELVQHRAAGPRGDAEVALQQLAEVLEVLLTSRGWSKP